MTKLIDELKESLELSKYLSDCLYNEYLNINRLANWNINININEITEGYAINILVSTAIGSKLEDLIKYTQKALENRYGIPIDLIIQKQYQGSPDKIYSCYIKYTVSKKQFEILDVLKRIG